MSIDKSHIEALSSEMKKILDAELAAGNEIQQTHKGWSSPDHICVFLKYPFRASVEYDESKVKYTDIDDRHYWKAEYDDMSSSQTIACNFGDE